MKQRVESYACLSYPESRQKSTKSNLVRVDVSFASFLCAREKEEEKPMVLGSKTYGFRRQNLWF